MGRAATRAHFEAGPNAPAQGAQPRTKASGHLTPKHSDGKGGRIPGPHDVPLGPAQEERLKTSGHPRATFVVGICDGNFCQISPQSHSRPGITLAAVEEEQPCPLGLAANDGQSPFPIEVEFHLPLPARKLPQHEQM